MSEWKEVKLGDVCEIVGGGTPSTKKPEYWNGDISWITPKDLSNYQKKYIFSGERNITEEGLKNSSTKILPKGTILFTSRAPIGYIAIAGKELCTNQGFKSLICKKEMYNQFLYYLMKYKTNEIIKLANGSTFKEISATNLKKLSINLPPLPIQKKIADILSVIDEKIETLQNINETLEEMAKAIFKSWFVDFEIVKAKASGKNDSEIAEEFGINEEIVKLFPSEFIDSEIGEIPKGWEIVYLKDVFDFERGVEPGSKFYIENPTNYEIQKDKLIPFYRVKDLETKANIYIPNEISKGKISKFGDVLVSFDGTIGRVNAFLEGAYSSGIRKIKATNYSNAFIYFLMKSDYIQDLIRKYATGTTILHAGKSINYLYLVKNNKIIKEYEKIIIPIFKTILSNAKQIQILQNLRDTLLPKLINGEIKVDELDIRGLE